MLIFKFNEDKILFIPKNEAFFISWSFDDIYRDGSDCSWSLFIHFGGETLICREVSRGVVDEINKYIIDNIKEENIFIDVYEFVKKYSDKKSLRYIPCVYFEAQDVEIRHVESESFPININICNKENKKEEE